MIARAVLVALPLLAGAPGQVPEAEPQATLSVDLKDADLHGILRVLAEVGGFQTVVDPDVACRLTLSVERVTWPVVLEQVLRACRLGAEAEGSVVRVAPMARLTEQTREQRALDERRGEGARRVRYQRLSYARAEELAPLIATLLGPRARVVFDKRSNTLIVVEN